MNLFLFEFGSVHCLYRECLDKNAKSIEPGHTEQMLSMTGSVQKKVNLEKKDFNCPFSCKW